MERTRLSVALILFLYILPVTFTQECDLPTEEEILALLENEIISQGGEEEMVNAVLDSNLTFTCLATSGSLKMYNAFSVVLRYREQPGDPLKVGQFEGECVTSGGNTGWQTTDNLRPASGSLLDLSTREDCYACRDVFNEDSCLSCDSACQSQYSGRCTSSGSDDCCPVFDGGVCADSCAVNFAPDMDDCYQCVCNLTCPEGFTVDLGCTACNLTDICLADNPCQNEGVCTLNSEPDDYVCNCTNTNYNGTNCTECECDFGYTVTGQCMCIPDNVCSNDEPCENGGICELDPDSVDPDLYDCDCVNEYVGMNCTICNLTCDDGYSPDDVCSICIVSDICIANNPCENGGLCTLESAPSNYRCNCENSNYSGVNCTDCSIICERGFQVSSTCDCVLSDICEADNPCQNGGTCVSGSDPDQYTCECVNEYDGENCTICDFCQNGGTEDRFCSVCTCPSGYTGTSCEITDRCSSNPCQNGNCTNLSDRFSCDCSTGYRGEECEECDDGFSDRGGTCENALTTFNVDNRNHSKSCLTIPEITGNDDPFPLWILAPIIIFIVLCIVVVSIIIGCVCYKKKKSTKVHV